MKDPYILEDGTLKNLLGITDYEELKRAETDIAYVKLMNAHEEVINKCDEKLLKKIHKHIFEDIFEQAGEYRTIPMEKMEVVLPGASLEYAMPNEIPKKLKRHMEEINSYNWKEMNIDEISQKFTKCLAQIWRVHPFRDGNTRATLTFADIFAKQHGFEMDMGMLLDNLERIVDDETGKIKRFSVRDKFVLAALDEKDYPEPEHLERIIKMSIEKGINKKIDSLNQIVER